MTDPLLVDISPWSPQGTGSWRRLAAAGSPWCGGILKASEGLAGYPHWFPAHRDALLCAGADRLEWLAGAYHFARFDSSGRAQAEHFLRVVGGAELVHVIDVERSAANATATRHQVEDTVTEWAATVGAETGRGVVLYGGAWLAELGVTSRMGCELLWYPAYTPRPRVSYERIGWTRDSLWAWQYCGADGRGVHAGLAGYPQTTPIGAADISALTLPGGAAATRARLQAA